MLIVHSKSTYVKPHKHLNKEETMMILAGSADYIIFDKENSNYLEKLFDKNNYFIIKNRLEDIDNIYLSKNILIFCIKNIFKRSLRLSYLIKLIEIINPKKILTTIDNDKDFYVISDYFKDKQMQFSAIQNASRNINLKKFF